MNPVVSTDPLRDICNGIKAIDNMKTTITRFFLTILILSGTSAINQARIIRIPADHPTISAGMQAAVSGDTVLVSPGEYFENLNFRGKNIVLTSMWYLDRDTSFIRTTIINGSQPVKADSASCVIFSHGENSSAVLQGFTITGGKGTKWRDIHGAGDYREGGGILIELSSPVVRYNMIIYNKAIATTGGVSGAGGGGIRIGDGNPQILNNIIAWNQGKYGAGIVLNYTGVTIRNNMIAYNTGSSTFNGGAGIWTYSVHGADERVIENNTFIGNEATVGTGGVLAQACKLILRNNIIWGNKPASKQTLTAEGGSFQATYNDIQNGLAGKGNINTDPLTGADTYQLESLSPCIDKGDSTTVYNDVEDNLNPGVAKYPGKGTVRNDMGAYGGPGAGITGYVRTGIPSGIPTVMIPGRIRMFPGYPNPASGFTTIRYALPFTEPVNFRVTDLSGRTLSDYSLGISAAGIHQFRLDVSSLSPGNYLCCLEANNQRAVQKLVVIR
jgi:hypothetical protein